MHHVLIIFLEILGEIIAFLLNSSGIVDLGKLDGKLLRRLYVLMKGVVS